LERQLQKESGLRGLSGLSVFLDMRQLREAQQQPCRGPAGPGVFLPQAALQGIGAMAARPGRLVDVIALTGGFGENDTMIQAELGPNGWPGLELFALVVVPPNREGMINATLPAC